MKLDFALLLEQKSCEKYFLFLICRAHSYGNKWRKYPINYFTGLHTLTANTANSEVYVLNVMNVMEIQALLMVLNHRFGSADQRYYFDVTMCAVHLNSTALLVCKEKKEKIIVNDPMRNDQIII